jgi:hypothetical protein
VSADEQVVVSYHKMQQMVGWIALLMPIVVRFLAWAFDDISATNSISAYYYTALRDVFVGSLVVGGLFLAFFRTDDRRDRWIAIVAGIAGIGIGLFPMDISQGVVTWAGAPSPQEEAKMIDALRHGPNGPIGYHFYFVGAFFLLTFYLVAFRFRANTPAIPTPQKLARNKWYVAFGVLMAIGFVWIAVLWWLDSKRSIFLPEAIAVMSFAAAWLVKGQLVLKDRVLLPLPPGKGA